MLRTGLQAVARRRPLPLMLFRLAWKLPAVAGLWRQPRAMSHLSARPETAQSVEVEARSKLSGQAHPLSVPRVLIRVSHATAELVWRRLFRGTSCEGVRLDMVVKNEEKNR